MRILFNVSTRRGIESILPLMTELGSRGHDLFTLVTTHPSAGLKHPYEFMKGENEGMTRLLDDVTEYTVHSTFCEMAMLSDIYKWNVDLHVTKADSGMSRDIALCHLVKTYVPGAHVVAQQTDWHMHISNNWYSEMFNVTGAKWKRYLTKRGVDPQHINVTGSIKSDRLLSMYSAPSGYGGIPFVVLFAHATYADDERQYIYDELAKFISSMGWRLVIKLHPEHEQYKNRDQERWEGTIKRGPICEHSILTNVNPYELMVDASLVVTSWSNTGYEAMLLNRPTLIVDVGKITDLYAGCGTIVEAKYPMGKAIASALLMDYVRGPLYPTWFEDQLYKVDGHTAERAADNIEEFMGNYT